MKTAIISDIHGNYPALEAVLADIAKEKADVIYCLGDLVGYYCMINEVIETLRQRHISSLMGNHDYALVYNQGVIDRSKTCTKILSRHLSVIKEENLQFLKQCGSYFAVKAGGKNLYCVHGGLSDPVDEYITTIDEHYFIKHRFGYDVLVSGHTHIPRNEVCGNKTYLNPGSVGQPRDGNPDACYLLISESGYVHKRVSYNIRKICDEMEKQGYDARIYQNLYKGRGVGSQ